MSHLEIARTSGPKAGFNAWIEQLQKSGLPQVQETLAEVQAQGNKKAQFDFYCAKFGTKFGTKQASAPVDEDDEIATLRARLAELIKRGQGVTKPATRSTPRASAPVVEREQTNPKFRPWAVRKHNIPTKVGAEFTYVGKRRSTKMRVVAIVGKGDARVIECERI